MLVGMRRRYVKIIVSKAESVKQKNLKTPMICKKKGKALSSCMYVCMCNEETQKQSVRFGDVGCWNVGSRYERGMLMRFSI